MNHSHWILRTAHSELNQQIWHSEFIRSLGLLPFMTFRHKTWMFNSNKYCKCSDSVGNHWDLPARSRPFAQLFFSKIKMETCFYLSPDFSTITKIITNYIDIPLTLSSIYNVGERVPVMAFKRISGWLVCCCRKFMQAAGSKGFNLMV